MPPVLEKVPAPSPVVPGRPGTEEKQSPTTITVIFTSVRSTLAALKRAGTLGSELSVRIKLVVPQVVPYPNPLTSSPVSQDWNEQRFRELMNESRVEATVQIYLCRDPQEAVNAVLYTGSMVIVGGPKRWWPTEEKRLARKLRRAGHTVIFEETQ